MKIYRSHRSRIAANKTWIGPSSTVIASYAKQSVPHGLGAAASLLLAALPMPQAEGRPSESASHDRLQQLLHAENRAGEEPNRARIEREYAALLEQDPANTAVRMAYAQFLARQGRPVEAAREIAQASKQQPADPDLAYLDGTLQFASGDVRAAALAFTRAAELSPKSAAIRFHLANLCYLFRNNLAGTLAPTPEEVLALALRRFAEATELDPSNPEYWRGYAETFYIVPEADWAEARRAWLRYLDLTREKDFARIHLARVALRLRDRADALRWLDELPPHHRLAPRLRAEAEAIEPP